MIKHIVILLVFLFGVSCKSNPSQNTDVPDQSKTLHDIWALEEINGEAVTAADFGREIPVLEFHTADQNVMGNSGCNQLSGSYKTDGNNITFGPLISTKMACPGNGEQRFLTALGEVNTFRIEGLKLYLLAGETEKLQFKKVD